HRNIPCRNNPGQKPDSNGGCFPTRVRTLHNCRVSAFYCTGTYPAGTIQGRNPTVMEGASRLASARSITVAFLPFTSPGHNQPGRPCRSVCRNEYRQSPACF